MSRDAQFLVLSMDPFGDEEPAFQELTAWFAGYEGRGGGMVARLSEFVTEPPRDPFGAPNRRRTVWARFGDVWLGATRNVYPSELLPVLAALPWRNPERVQVLVHDQDDDVYGLYVLRDGALVEAPQPGTRRVPDGDFLSVLLVD
jgi:hypothetical protein